MRKLRHSLKKFKLFREINKLLQPLIKEYRSKQWKKKKISNGEENPDKIFYLIHDNDLGRGIFSCYSLNAGKCLDAINHGYIPVIDMMNYPSLYLTEDQIGKVNAWELFFKQPFGYNVNSIKSSKYIVMSGTKFQCDMPFSSAHFLNNEETKDFWRKFCSKYLPLNNETEKHIKREYEKMIKGKSRVLGVLCRGTDYTILKPTGHPIQPEVDEVIKKAKNVMGDYNCDTIFLASEDINIVIRFQEVFGERLIVYQKNFVEYNGGTLAENYKKDVSISIYERTLEYLTVIGILSKCNCLIAGMTGGTVGAVLLSKGFEYEYYWDLGVYF